MSQKEAILRGSGNALGIWICGCRCILESSGSQNCRCTRSLKISRCKRGCPKDLRVRAPVLTQSLFTYVLWELNYDLPGWPANSCPSKLRRSRVNIHITSTIVSTNYQSWNLKKKIIYRLEFITLDLLILLSRYEFRKQRYSNLPNSCRA